MAVSAAGAGNYQFVSGQDIYKVHPERTEKARSIDSNRDLQLQDEEILDYLQRNDDMPDPQLANVNVEKVLKDFKDNLQMKKPESMAVYHSYDQLADQLDQLQQQYPNLAKRVSLGQTHEGREIYALKVTNNVASDSTAKPAVVVTGCHHAREWATTEVPMSIAREVLAEYSSSEAGKSRLDNNEIWFVPVVNPDGYTYSREQDSWWRKNRRPIEETPCGPTTGNPVGVDLNRNYADNNPEHATIYRPAGDEPCNYRDDGRATSDNPFRDTYRGPSGASEIEIQKLLELELNHGNVKGVLDFHSYGGMILYPWGHENKEVENVETYRAVGTKMNDALGDTRYRLMQSIGLYPTSGGSHDIHQANGIFSITMEIGDSFHPSEQELGPIVERTTRAGKVFVDEVFAMNHTPDPDPDPDPDPNPDPDPQPSPPWYDRCNPFKS